MVRTLYVMMLSREWVSLFEKGFAWRQSVQHHPKYCPRKPTVPEGIHFEADVMSEMPEAVAEYFVGPARLRVEE
jgi:hypothetical protein